MRRILDVGTLARRAVSGSIPRQGQQSLHVLHVLYVRGLLADLLWKTKRSIWPAYACR